MGKYRTQKNDLAPNVWLLCSVGRASGTSIRGGHGFESRWSPEFVFRFRHSKRCVIAWRPKNKRCDWVQHWWPDSNSPPPPLHSNVTLTEYTASTNGKFLCLRVASIFLTPSSAGGGGGTSCDALYWGEAPPERGIILRLEVYKKAGISQVEVQKRVRTTDNRCLKGSILEVIGFCRVGVSQSHF